jgi:hypothetical protein
MGQVCGSVLWVRIMGQGLRVGIRGQDFIGQDEGSGGWVRRIKLGQEMINARVRK